MQVQLLAEGTGGLGLYLGKAIHHLGLQRAGERRRSPEHGLCAMEVFL